MPATTVSMVMKNTKSLFFSENAIIFFIRLFITYTFSSLIIIGSKQASFSDHYFSFRQSIFYEYIVSVFNAGMHLSFFKDQVAFLHHHVIFIAVEEKRFGRNRHLFHRRSHVHL